MKKRRSSSAGGSARDPISFEDRLLWKRVADSTTPLSARRARQLEDEMARLMEGTAPPTVQRPPRPNAYALPQVKQATPQSASTPQPAQNKHHHPIEEPVAKKLAKGRLPIDSRIDLHGMTQDRARFALLDFLQMAQREGQRIVLVITGKGNEGRGVLRQNVPHWLEQPQFRACTNGYRTAHVSHGGDGALYVRIRKPVQRRLGSLRP